MLYILNPLSTTRGQQKPEQHFLRVWPPEIDVRMEDIRAQKSRKMENKIPGTKILRARESHCNAKKHVGQLQSKTAISIFPNNDSRKLKEPKGLITQTG